MSSVQDAFRHNKARKNVIVAGGLILVCITLLSCVSSFMIYREGFADTPWFVQQSLSMFAVIVVEGAFIWLVYGFTRAFASFSERIISLAGMAFLVCVMLTNIITHFMMVKHLSLSPFQEAWLSWGAVSVFIAVLIFVLLITLSDPVTRLIRLELRYLGKQQETILQAKTDGLESERIQVAMIERAEIEAEELATQIVGVNRQLPRGASSRLYQQPQRAYLKKGKRIEPQTGAETVAQLKEAQPKTTPSSVIDIQSHRRRSEANNYLKSEEPVSEDEVESNIQEMGLQRDGTYGVPVWPVETDRASEKQYKKSLRPNFKKTSLTSQPKGLKKRSLKKAKALDMPPTPNGHDWHVTDGGWNLVKSWSEKDGLMGARVKKERYAGYLSRDAWQVMKEYEYEKIIAQIGQSGRHSRS